jgi:hypothetical protein
VSFKEHPDFIKSLDQAADIHGLNRSGFIRQALREKMGLLHQEDREDEDKT